MSHSVSLGTTTVLPVAFRSTQTVEIIEVRKSSWCPARDYKRLFSEISTKSKLSHRRAHFQRENRLFSSTFQMLPSATEHPEKHSNIPQVSTTNRTTKSNHTNFNNIVRGDLMARMNIEECWWTDPRRSLLIKNTGSEELADGAIIKAWRLAQEFWKNQKGLVPIDLFETLPHFKEIISAKLADVRGAFVYVRGSSAYLDWVREKRDQASEAGKKSAQSRKSKFGTAQPKGKKSEKESKNVERASNESRTEFNALEPSGSYSGSSSGSYSDSGSNNSANAQKTKSFIARYCENFKARYQSNPEIGKKEAGIAKRISERFTEEKICLYLDAYFEMPDSWLIKSKHPLAAFESRINEITVFANSGKFTTSKQARDLDSSQSTQNLLDMIDRGEV